MRNNLITSELKQEESFKNRKDLYSSLAYLAMMPFHHLLSAKEIYSSIYDQSLTIDISKENDSKNEISSTELQRLIQEAVSEQNPDNADPVTFDDYVSAEFFESGDDGEQLKTNWTAPFRGSSFQGSAEIYRAEMFLFKRLICERKEKLEDTFILTDKEFAKYIDYEMFERLTGGEPEMLLLNSLTSLYEISVTLPDDIKAGDESASDNKSQNDEQSSQLNYDSAGKDTKENLHSHSKAAANTSILTERIHSWKSIPVASDEKSDHKSNSLSDKRHTAAELPDGNINSFEESPLITLYKLNLGSYWRKWQQAAQTARFDFDLLQKLEGIRAIRFYELTKFLRLGLFDETMQSIPNELEIEYQRFTKLMPLPTFQTENEIELQIADLIKPFKEINYVKFFLHKNRDEKASYILTFQFSS